ncbi:matrixin family metalloprotease [Archangium violaceum]|uniref:M57 family metalloprotease n=1 Tax=Archangium violaceum TaxID=83451 RepID=UPI00193C71B5|nr:M57 family metalloprotease [Archangium violaceum]QRK08982.1 matrixin family metalloprotease [Archangium violaceum]
MTKSRIVASLAGLSLLATVGCGGADGLPDTGPVGQALSWEEFRAQVYQDPEGVFIVNGDTPIHNEKLLREFYEQYVKPGQLIVHTSGGTDAKWNDTQKLNITYCVSSTFGTNYSRAVQEMASAAAAWEAVANIKFVYVSAQDSNCTASNSNVVFDVRPVNSGGQYLARAFFPDSPRSARNVLIDTTAFGNTSPWTLTGILRHELGHTLGFRHEHTRPESGTCFEDSNWRALTTYDSSSVMHYPQCNGSQTGDLVITAKDEIGAATLYGTPNGEPPPTEPPPPSGTPVTETVSGSVAKNQDVNHGPYSVVAGTTFKVTMTGSGDPDLYVQFGSAPTSSSFACRPYANGASESCNVTVPEGQTSAYIMVRGYAAGTYSLNIEYTKPSSTSTPVSETVTGSVSASQNKNHGPYSVVAGTTFKVVMSGSGDPDLYVRFGSAPTTSSYDCRPYRDGAAETCELTVPAGESSAYIMVRGYTAATYSLAISYTKP